MFAACGDETPPEPEPVMLENGAACMADSPDEVCTSGLCVEEFKDGTQISGGFCTDECIWDETDGSDTCPEEELCVRYTATDEYYCFQDCASDADCRTEDGWECLCLDFFCGYQVCVPPLESANGSLFSL